MRCPRDKTAGHRSNRRPAESFADRPELRRLRPRPDSAGGWGPRAWVDLADVYDARAGLDMSDAVGRS